MVEIKREDLYWAAYTKETKKVFVVVKKGPPFEGSWFHGVGFWVSDPDMEKKLAEPGERDLVEEWIHGSNIDHVRSLMYKQR